MNETEITNAAKPAASPHKSWLIFLLAFYIVWALRATVLYRIDASFQSDLARHAYSDFIKFVIWVVPTFLYLKYVDRVNPFAYLKLSTRIEAAGLGFALVLLWFIGIQVVEHFTNHRTILLGAQLTASQWTTILLTVAGAPIIEEIFYRGFVLQKFRDLFRFWTANIITTALFILVHWFYWLYSGQTIRQVIVSSLQILPLSLMLGWLVKKTNSLYPSILLHLLNNLTSFVFGSLK
jgi:membrane protease YdiL (CAAX protease family)